jgi:hypothetical protein
MSMEKRQCLIVMAKSHRKRKTMKCEDCSHEPNSQGCIEAFDCDCDPFTREYEKKSVRLLLVQSGALLASFFDTPRAGCGA